MSKFETMANEIVTAVGGVSNIEAVTNCMTRLRFTLKDVKKADENTLKVVKNKPWQTLGVGALILLLTPMACFILFCTVIGIIPAAA